MPGNDSEAELDTPKVLPSQSIRDDCRPFSLQKGQSSNTAIEIGCPPTFISHPCTNSLPPLYATLPTAAMLPRCASSPSPTPASTSPCCRRQARSRASTRNAPRHSDVPFPSLRPLLLSLFCRLPVILMHIAQLCATFSLTLCRYDRLFWLSHYLNGRDHARARSPSTPASSRCWIPTAYQPPFPPPPRRTPLRIIKSADQQANIFLHEKLKVGSSSVPPFLSLFLLPSPSPAFLPQATKSAPASTPSAHRFSNWAVQHCLEAAMGPEERPKIVAYKRGRIVDLATNCYGCHVLQKALDCEEEEITELSWTPPAPLIFAYPSRTSRTIACHESGWLVVQHAFENLEESAKDGIVDELLGQVGAVFSEVAKSQWGSYCIQHILEHVGESPPDSTGSPPHWPAQESGKEMLERVVQHMCEPAKGFVLLPTFLSFSRLAVPIPLVGDPRAALYDCIRVHIVTLRGCKTGFKAIWLLYVHPIQFLLYPLSCVFFSSD
ncbi:hypothetical protein B0H13DRAFT_2314274 [Mycena leptocephala]|nr:hypothetical protein B0H13DRAFT_2314274 [Mycena leptocephala]